jgi:acyl-CoA thioester hydrolase
VIAAGPRTIYHTRVQWADTDAAGIHHNSAIGRFAEAAEAALVREAGLVDWFPVTPRVRFEVDYRAPLLPGQEVTIELWVAAVGTTSATLAFEVWGEPHDGRARVQAAAGQYVVVHVDGPPAGRSTHSTPWPTAWAAALLGRPDA